MGTDRVQTLPVPIDGGPNTLSNVMKRDDRQNKGVEDRPETCSEGVGTLFTASVSQYGEAAEIAGS